MCGSHSLRYRHATFFVAQYQHCLCFVSLVVNTLVSSPGRRLPGSQLFAVHSRRHDPLVRLVRIQPRLGDGHPARRHLQPGRRRRRRDHPRTLLSRLDGSVRQGHDRPVPHRCAAQLPTAFPCKYTWSTAQPRGAQDCCPVGTMRSCHQSSCRSAQHAGNCVCHGLVDTPDAAGGFDAMSSTLRLALLPITPSQLSRDPYPSSAAPRQVPGITT